MAQADVGRGISLEWEAFGDRKNEPLILIMGLGAQMLLWPDAFCEQLAARGFWVVRFDNRDVGLSTKLHSLGVPNILPRLLLRAAARVRLASPYTLSDMARDTVGLMDALGIADAHIVGMSMDGMIAQTIAIEHPERVRSLVSYASTNGDFGLPNGRPEVLRALTAKPPTDGFEAAVAFGVNILKTIGSPAYHDPIEARKLVIRGMERSTYRLGMARQFAAILAAEPRSTRLKNVRVPTTIIHGRIDGLLPLAHGEATARAIPGAKLVVLDTMAHDVPRPLWPQLIDAIEQNARRAIKPAAAAARA